MPEITENELSDGLKALWLKALSAVQMNNHAYAVSLLSSVIKENPNFLEGRRLLRFTEIQINGNVPKKKTTIFGIQAGGNASKYLAQAKKDAFAAIYAIEKDLEKDPLNASLNEALYDIFMQVGLAQTAAFCIETLRKFGAAGVPLLHRLATHYLNANNPAEAAEVYNDILKISPIDSIAIKGAKDASARASMMKQKWDEGTDMRSLLKNAGETEQLEKKSRAGLTKEQLKEHRNQLLVKYNENKNDLGISKELAAIYEQLEYWPEAYNFYEWAFSLSNGDVSLSNKASQMRDRAVEEELQQMEDQLKANPNDADLAARYNAFKKERALAKVSEVKQKVEQNPTDPHLRYEFGLAYYNIGEFSEAIPHLQQATRNPHIRTRVLLLLGKTFKAKNMLDLCVKQLQDALADLQMMDGTKKEVLYELGCVYSDMGKKEEALNAFKQIYETDYSYLDVASRVESSYQ